MFPTNEEFQKGVVSKQTVMKWREVPLNTILKITKVDQINTKFGETAILTLENKEGDVSKCWASQMLGNELTDFGWRGECFVKSLGMIESKKNPSQKYYSYELFWKDQQRYNTVN